MLKKLYSLSSGLMLAPKEIFPVAPILFIFSLSQLHAHLVMLVDG
jgi:hypothetical protein